MARYRTQRVGDLLLGFLADELRRMHDPRLPFVTLTAVEMTNDLKYAKVYWCLSVGASSEAETRQALDGAKSLLKRRIAEELDLRYVPELTFKFDETPEKSARIEDLLKKAGY